LERLELNHPVKTPDDATARPRPSAGFTVLELMVVVAIVAVLIAVAVPSFRDITQRNRIAAEVNSFVGDLQYARSEAVKRGMPVCVCASADGTSCVGTNTWHQGWIVFSDVNGSCTIDAAAGDLVIRKRIGWAGSDTFVATPSVTAVSYNRQGFANLSAGDVTWPLRTAPVNARATRCVTVNRVGRQVVQSPGTGACT
jgi:type IV fimbrial biogenesis protein FimT